MSPHPAPLVAPTGRRTWYFPVAAAAVIVLAVAVTWQVEREQGDDGATLSQSAPAPELRKEKKVLEEEPRKQAEARKPAPLAKRAERPAETPAEKPAAPEPFAREPGAAAPPAESAAGTLSQSRADAYGQRENRQMQRDEAQPAARAKAAQEPPEKWLERIAQLREQGRHDEADKALAEFRKRYPDYRIPEATLEKVEKK